MSIDVDECETERKSHDRPQLELELKNLRLNSLKYLKAYHSLYIVEISMRLKWDSLEVVQTNNYIDFKKAIDCRNVGSDEGAAWMNAEEMTIDGQQ